jgi:hypothetical protein
MTLFYLWPAAPQRRDAAKAQKALSGNIPGTQKQAYIGMSFKY